MGKWSYSAKPSQQTDKAEFYPFLRKSQPTDLMQALREWEVFYNQKRPHSSLHGETPWEKLMEVKQTIPTEQQVQEQYQKKKHPILARNYFFMQWQKKNGVA